MIAVRKNCVRRTLERILRTNGFKDDGKRFLSMTRGSMTVSRHPVTDLLLQIGDERLHVIVYLVFETTDEGILLDERFLESSAKTFSDLTEAFADNIENFPMPPVRKGEGFLHWFAGNDCHFRMTTDGDDSVVYSHDADNRLCIRVSLEGKVKGYEMTTETDYGTAFCRIEREFQTPEELVESLRHEPVEELRGLLDGMDFTQSPVGVTRNGI